jgi:hypothetical protein
MQKTKNNFHLMRRLSNGFIPFLLTAILLPTFSLIILGIYFIYLNGYFIYFITFLFLLSILYFGMYSINVKYRKNEIDNTESISVSNEWSENDKKLFEKIEAMIEDRFKKNIEWLDLKDFSFEIISLSASWYKPNSWGNKELSFSVSELLMAIEELSNRYRGYINKYIPFEDKIPISILKLGYDNKDTLENVGSIASKTYSFYRIARFTNPIMAILAEIKGLIQSKALKGISLSLQDKAKKELMMEVAAVSIDLYRGYFKKNKIKVEKNKKRV